MPLHMWMSPHWATQHTAAPLLAHASKAATPCQEVRPFSSAMQTQELCSWHTLCPSAPQLTGTGHATCSGATAPPSAPGGNAKGVPLSHMLRLGALAQPACGARGARCLQAQLRAPWPVATQDSPSAVLPLSYREAYERPSASAASVRLTCHTHFFATRQLLCPTTSTPATCSVLVL